MYQWHKHYAGSSPDYTSCSRVDCIYRLALLLGAFLADQARSLKDKSKIDLVSPCVAHLWVEDSQMDSAGLNETLSFYACWDAGQAHASDHQLVLLLLTVHV